MNEFTNRIIVGDVLRTLKEIPNDSVDLVITSPPYYHQRDYGNNSEIIGAEDTPEDYVEKLVSVILETERIIKDTGSIIFNVGDKYDSKGSLMLIPYRFAIDAMRKSKLKLINDISWVKPNPQPRQFKRRLVSCHEPFFHFVKSNRYKYYPDRFESLISEEKKVIKRSGEKIGSRYFGLIEKSTLTDEQKENARRDLLIVISEAKKGEIASFRMKIKGIHAPAYGGYEGGRKMHMESRGYTIIRMPGNTLKRDVIVSPKALNQDTDHPAVFPESVVERLVHLTTDTGDVVLDPFVGSGTTCVVAKKNGRDYIGIDINETFCNTARMRLDAIPLQYRIENWNKGLLESTGEVK